MRVLIAALVLALCAAAAGVAVLVVLPQDRGDGEEEAVVMPQSPMPGRILAGFLDDVSLRWAPERAETLDRADEAGAAVIRTIVVWAQAAPERPVDPADPFDPVYRLEDVDDLARSAQERGMELLVTIWGTPPWANGGHGTNRAPADPLDLELFAQALADRYSGRHQGYPAVRLFSAWNEPNLEQFLAPQFDARGRSVAPGLYAPIARAIHDGVKRGNPDALVAVGETSPRGHDLPSRGSVQDSHSPALFARLLSEESPTLPFDAWAQHPYPPRPNIAPDSSVRWPRVGLGNLERLGASLDEWFGRQDTPFWLTEYAHETLPGNPLGIEPTLQATYAADALEAAARSPRVRVFIWFVLRDAPSNPWRSGLLRPDGTPKPALRAFRDTATRLDARNPVLPVDAEVARLPVLELAFYTVAGNTIELRMEGRQPFSVVLRPDGWLDVPVEGRAGMVQQVRAIDAHGHSVSRVVRFQDVTAELD